MAFATVETIVQDVIKDLGLVTGTGVQQYTEPMVMQALNNMFDFLYNKRQWEHLTAWDRYTLNGTTGLVASSFASIYGWEDIREVRRVEDDTIIPRSNGREHLDATGNKALYYTILKWNDADIAKWIRFWPQTATGQVDILTMTRPVAVFEAPETIVPMNPLLMKQGTLWYVLAGDGLNPANADKAQGMFDISYQDLVAKMNEGDIGHGPNRYRDDIVTIQP